MKSGKANDPSLYETERLLADDRFVNWVQQPTPLEDRYWNALAAANPIHAERQKEARDILSALTKHYEQQLPSAGATQAAYQQWKGRRDVAVEEGGGARKTPLWVKAASVAAGFLLIVTACFFLLGEEEAEDTGLYFATGYGERLHTMLPDSTEVYMNANSTLSWVPAGASPDVRRVVLTGEAYFHVSRYPDGRQFEVVSDDLKVNVSGTQFNVYARNERSAVTLEEGKVSVDYEGKTGKNTVDLEPGERLVYDAFDQEAVSEQIAVRPVVSWKDGLLVFQNEPLGEVAARLEELFGVTIIFKDEDMRQRPVMLSTSSDDLNMFFEVLDKLSPKQLNVQRRGDTIRVSELPLD